MNSKSEGKRQETRLEVQSFVGNLRYAIESDSAKISIVKNRRVDQNRDPKFTNRYTLSELFPDEDQVEAIKRELIQVNYIFIEMKSFGVTDKNLLPLWRIQRHYCWVGNAYSTQVLLTFIP